MEVPDALGIVASLIAIVTFIWKLVQYGASARDWSASRARNQQDLATDRFHYKQIVDNKDLHRVSATATSSSQDPSTSNAALRRLIARSNELEFNLSPEADARSFSAALRLPQAEQQTRDAFAAIERKKSAVGLSMAHEARQNIRQVAGSITRQKYELLALLEESREMRDDVTLLLGSMGRLQVSQSEINSAFARFQHAQMVRNRAEERLEILNWLGKPGSAAKHQEMLKNVDFNVLNEMNMPWMAYHTIRHLPLERWQEQQCSSLEDSLFNQWLSNYNSIDHQPKFLKWLETKGSTLLWRRLNVSNDTYTAAVIVHIKNMARKSDKKIGLAYSYIPDCSGDMALLVQVADLLRQLAADLDVVPPSLQEFHRQARRHIRPPSLQHFYNAFKDTVACYDRVFIVLDGLELAIISARRRGDLSHMAQLMDLLLLLQLEGSVNIFLTSIVEDVILLSRMAGFGEDDFVTMGVHRLKYVKEFMQKYVRF